MKSGASSPTRVVRLPTGLMVPMISATLRVETLYMIFLLKPLMMIDDGFVHINANRIFRDHAQPPLKSAQTDGHYRHIAPMARFQLQRPVAGAEMPAIFPLPAAAFAPFIQDRRCRIFKEKVCHRCEQPSRMH